VRKSSASTATGLEANKALSVMLNASKVQKKTSLPAQPNRCWSWDHWKAADAQTHGNSPVSYNFEALSKTKPLLQCCHCQKRMSWNPSTKRKQHLLASCSKFLQSDAGKDSSIMSEREELLQKMGQNAKVCLPSRHPVLDRSSS
jgi:hypothetical protein